MDELWRYEPLPVKTMLDEAVTREFLVRGEDRLGVKALVIWEQYCRREGRPCIVVTRRGRVSSIVETAEVYSAPMGHALALDIAAKAVETCRRSQEA
jgi:hypothetical protein